MPLGSIQPGGAKPLLKNSPSPNSLINNVYLFAVWRGVHPEGFSLKETQGVRHIR
jgi:hypothetical protein